MVHDTENESCDLEKLLQKIRFYLSPFAIVFITVFLIFSWKKKSSTSSCVYIQYLKQSKWKFVSHLKKTPNKPTNSFACKLVGFYSFLELFFINNCIHLPSNMRKNGLPSEIIFFYSNRKLLTLSHPWNRLQNILYIRFILKRKVKTFYFLMKWNSLFSILSVSLNGLICQQRS